MSNRNIEIIIDVRDNTKGKVKGLADDLKRLDAAAQRINNRIRAIGLQRFAATIRLIDRVTNPASQINSLLKRIAGTTYRVTMNLNDSVLGKIRQVESTLLRITGKTYNIAVNVKGAALNKLNGLMSGAAMGAGMFMPLGAAAGMGFGAVNAVQASMGFERQMSRVQALRQLEKDSDEMHQLTQKAKELGMSTVFTREEVGKAMEYQALAGWEVPQILKATPHMLNLASAGGMDLGTTSDLLTDAMTAFNLQATNFYRNSQGREIDMPEYFADMLAKVQASSNTDLYQLREAIKYGAPTIGTMFAGVEGQEGIQLRTEAARQMMIMAGLMANAGIKGSMAGTGINTLFNRLAGENRNTFFAERLLGLEHAENGNMLMPLDFIKAFQNRVKNGMDVNDFMQIAEELAGEKIHADTRRKLNSTIESALKNGGRLGSADVMKMSSMLAGLENMPKLLAMVFQDIDKLEAKMNDVEGTAAGMANTQLDNLAGSFTRLSSAWDAFQQDLFTGTAGSGLRNFVDTLTEIVARANKLFQDGIQIGDFGRIIGDVIDRLKNKFLELDGIGSILAGGALVAGLTKIISLSQRALNAIRNVGKAGAWGTATAGAKGLAAAQRIGAMNVSAGVVNVNGAIRGMTGGGIAGVGGYSLKENLATSRANANMANLKVAQLQAAQFAAWQKVAAERAFVTSGTKLVALTSQAEKLSAQVAVAQSKAIQANRLVAQLNSIAAAEAYNAKRAREMARLANESSSIATSGRFAGMRSAAGGAAAFAGIFSIMDMMNLKSANAERLAAATSESDRAQIAIENCKAEFEAGAGAAGSIFGAAAGAAIGSAIGPVGTMIGGMIGSMLGEYAGKTAANNAPENKTTPIRNYFDDKPASTVTEKVLSAYGLNGELESKITARKRGIARAWGENLSAIEQETKFRNIDKTLGAFSPFRYDNEIDATRDYYRQQRERMMLNPQEYYGTRDLWGGSRAEAAELTPEQMAQQLAMERGEFYPQNEMPAALETPESAIDLSSVTEQLYSDLEALQQGVAELFSGFGESITEQLTTAFEGAGETFSTFGQSVTEGLTATFESAGEIFSHFGESITTGMESAQTAAVSSLTMIQTTFTTTKEQIQSSWSELPSFFNGVFSGLGGAAASAGAAIAAGLIAPIGSVIAAWQSAAAQISSIISSINTAGASAGGGGVGKAEGGFVSSETHYYAGEHGPEVIIPLGSSHRARAMDLLEKTAAILGGENVTFGADELQSTVGEGFKDLSGAMPTLEADTPVNQNYSPREPVGIGEQQISISGVNINFEIGSVIQDAGDFMTQIKNNAKEISDLMAGCLAEAVSNIHQNQSLTA